MKHSLKLTAIILLLFSSTVFGGERLINTTVDGAGSILNDNIATARKNAIDDALKKAVEQAVQSIVSSTKIAQSYDLLDENIYSKSRGYTSNYKVLSENSVGNLYQIKLEAIISTALLEEDLVQLGLIASRGNIPRILLLISQEQSDGSHQMWWGNAEENESPMGDVENIIMQKLAEQDYKTANKAQIPSGKDFFSLNEDKKPGQDTIAYLASRYNCDMVLYGRAYSMAVNDGSNNDSARVHAVVSFSLFDGKNGQLIATSENEEITDRDDMQKAFHATTQVLSERVMGHIAAFWQNNSNTVKTVKMNISGVNSYVNFMSFQNSLKNKVKGVQEVKQRGFGAGVAMLDITLKGNVQSLADELTMLSYDGFSIDITEMSFDKISVTMKKL